MIPRVVIDNIEHAPRAEISPLIITTREELIGIPQKEEQCQTKMMG